MGLILRSLGHGTNMSNSAANKLVKIFILEAPGKLQEAPGKPWEAPGGSERLQETPEGSREALGGSRDAPGGSWREVPGAAATPEVARREHDVSAAGALTRSRAPRGDNIKRTSITTDQRLEDLTRLGPEARRICFPFSSEGSFAC